MSFKNWVIFFVVPFFEFQTELKCRLKSFKFAHKIVFLPDVDQFLKKLRLEKKKSVVFLIVVLI